MYGTIPYGSVTEKYGTVKGDTWITKSSVITKLIRTFYLSKNYRKIKVPGVMMRTHELGNTA